MATLYREFDACNECRLEVGGPAKYKVLTDDEIRDVLNAFECRTKLAKVTQWLETNQPDVFRRGMWDAILKVGASNTAVLRHNVELTGAARHEME